MSRLIFAAAVTAAAMLGLSGGKADAAATEAGKYYRVPLQALPYGSGEVTSTTGQLLIYRQDDGTTVAQLIARASVKSSLGFALMRSDAPAEAAFLFGSMDTLYVDHWQGGTDPNDEIVVTLTGDDGNVYGIKIQLVSAEGTPLTAGEVHYEAAIANKPTATGIAQLSADGMIHVPVISAHDNFRGKVDLQFQVRETSTGATYTFPDKHQQLKYGDGVTTVGIPVLNNPDARPAGVDVYSAEVFGPDGKPAAGAAVRLSPANYPSRNGYSTRQPALLGPEGKLLLAYPKPDQPELPNRPRVLSVEFLDKQKFGRRFTRIMPGEHEVIHAPLQISFNLLDASGKPLELEYPAGTSEFDMSLPTLHQLDSERRWQVNVKRDPNNPTRYNTAEIREPGRYLATAHGRFFKPVVIDRTTTHVSFQLDPVSFNVSGKVVDNGGKPVADAYVIVEDPTVSPNQAVLVGDSSGTSFTKMWEESNGDFDELGFYLTRTNADGGFSLEGEHLSNSAYLVVSQPGRSMRYVNSISTRPRPVSGFTPYVERFAGNMNLEPLVLEDEATITLQLTGKPRKEGMLVNAPSEPRLWPMLRKDILQSNDDGSTGTRFKAWSSTPTMEAGKWNISVPTETTFSLTLRGTEYDGLATTKVLDVLQPGEVRDLGTF